MKKLIIILFLFSITYTFAIDRFVDIDLIRQPSSPRLLEEGFLFTLPTDTGYSIFLRMNADNWQKDYYFHKNLFNVWCLYVPYNDISGNGLRQMQYKLNIDGFWDNDPSNSNYIYDRFHEKISVLDIPANQNNCKTTMPIISQKNRSSSVVTFKYYNPDVKNVTLVCSDSNWAIFSENMSLDQFGYWSIDMSFGKGTFYYYFLADWEKTLDDLNPNYEYDSNFGEVNKFTVN